MSKKERVVHLHYIGAGTRGNIAYEMRVQESDGSWHKYGDGEHSYKSVRWVLFVWRLGVLNF